MGVQEAVQNVKLQEILINILKQTLENVLFKNDNKKIGSYLPVIKSVAKILKRNVFNISFKNKKCFELQNSIKQPA